MHGRIDGGHEGVVGFSWYVENKSGIHGDFDNKNTHYPTHVYHVLWHFVVSRSHGKLQVPCYHTHEIRASPHVGRNINILEGVIDNRIFQQPGMS